jgi:hypothetical protein
MASKLRIQESIQSSSEGRAPCYLYKSTCLPVTGNNSPLAQESPGRSQDEKSDCWSKVQYSAVQGIGRCGERCAETGVALSYRLKTLPSPCLKN